MEMGQDIPSQFSSYHLPHLQNKVEHCIAKWDSITFSPSIHSPLYSQFNTQLQITPLHSQKHQGNYIIIQCSSCFFNKAITAPIWLMHFYQKKISA